MGPMCGMYGTLDADLEVQRTIERVELMAFLCLLGKAIGPTIVHVHNKGIIDGLWKCEMRYIGLRAKGADMRILIREELHRAHQEDILVKADELA